MQGGRGATETPPPSVLFLVILPKLVLGLLLPSPQSRQAWRAI